MKRIAFALLLCASASPAFAMAPPADPRQEALSQEVLECLNTKIGLRAQSIADQKEIAALKAEMATLKPAPKDAPPQH